MPKGIRIVDRRQIQQEIIQSLLSKGAQYVLPKIPGSLKHDLEQWLVSATHGRLYLDPYWAVYVHDGRPATRRGPGKSPFIWFRNRNQDPRLQGGRTPNRYKHTRHLRIRETGGDFTRSEFFRRVRAGEIILTRRVGPQKPQPFFSNENGGGMQGFLGMMRPELKQRALGLTRSELARGRPFESVLVGFVQRESLALRLKL